MNRKLLCAMMCTVILFMLTGCGMLPGGQAGDACLQLTDAPATALDNVWYNPGGIFRCAVFDSLLLPDAQMKTLSPALAQSYSVSEDGKTFEFTLRKDVKWHDGEAFDAQDVVFSVRALLRSEEVNGVLNAAFGRIEGAQAFADGETDALSGVTADGRKVIFRLTDPVGSFLEAVAQFAILPEHLLGQVDPAQLAQHDFWKKPVGTGCYRVAEAQAGKEFLLEANDRYYGDKPGIRRMRIRLDEADPIRAMQAGELDFYVTGDPEEIAQLKGIEDCSEHRLNILFPAYLIMNLSEEAGVNPALCDVRVRRALLLALDRRAIVETIFPGSAVSDTLVPAWDSWYCAEAQPYAYDPDAARALLEEAGFDFTKPLRLRYSVKGQSTKDLMNAIAVYWRAIGIQVDLARFEGSGSKHMFTLRDFDICYKRLSAFNHASIYEEVYGEGVMQQRLLGMPVYDELVETLSVTMEEEARREIVCKMQRLDQEYLLRLPLFALANVAYVNDACFDMPDAYGNLWYRYDLQFKDWRLTP